MKQETMVKLALVENIDFRVKCNIAKFIDKSFPGSIESVKKQSKTMRDITFVRENNR